MIQSKRFVAFGIISYLLLIIHEHVFIVHNHPNKHESNGIALTQQLPSNDDDPCLPLPPSPKVPRVYVHIGPHKTGTTSLQDFLACNTDFLRKHDTYYLGKINPYDVAPCTDVPPDFLRPLLQTPSIYALDKLRLMIQWYRTNGNSVILSSEDIFDVQQNYTDALFANMTHVFPVATYRRYHDWLVSSYRFRYGEPKWYDMETWRKWDGHDDIPTFRTFARRHADRWHPTSETLRSFSRTVERVTGETTCPLMLNFHAGDITKQFTRFIAEDDADSPSSWYSNVYDETKSYAVDSEILALKLHREGRLHSVLSRRVVADVLRKKMRSLYKNSTPPLDCFSPEEEEALLATTKMKEERIVPEYYRSPRGKEALEAEFRYARDEKRAFCNIVLDEMLKERGWEKLLGKLKAGRLRQEDFHVEPS